MWNGGKADLARRRESQGADILRRAQCRHLQYVRESFLASSDVTYLRYHLPAMLLTKACTGCHMTCQGLRVVVTT